MEKSFEDLARERYSCRSYDASYEPEAEEMNYILESARLAPSACNRQPWRLLVIGHDDADGRRVVAEAYSREWVTTAPVYIVVCGVPGEAWVRSFDGVNHVSTDTAILTEHICLAAASLGLGSCWICNFDPEVLTRGLGVPEGVEPAAIVPIGRPAEGSVVPEKKRKPLDEIMIKR